MILKEGTKIKLKDYQEFIDYQKHKGQIATIVGEASEGGFHVRWKDGKHSVVWEDNLLVIRQVTIDEL